MAYLSQVNYCPREKGREQKRRWRAAHPEKVLSTRLKRAEYHKAYNKRWYAENREQRLAATKEWQRANWGAFKAQQKEYQRANPQVMAAAYDRYRRKNPLKMAEWASRRRARKNATSAAPIDYKAILSAYEMKCGICRKPLDLFGTHFDHVVPLSRGGAHTKDNIQPAHALCNLRKGANVA